MRDVCNEKVHPKIRKQFSRKGLLVNSVKERYAQLLHVYCMDMHQLWVEGSNIGYDKYAELTKKADALSGSQPTAKDYEVLRADCVNVLRSWCGNAGTCPPGTYANYAHRRLKEISVEFPPSVEVK